MGFPVVKGWNQFPYVPKAAVIYFHKLVFFPVVSGVIVFPEKLLLHLF
jgi:hypothetical protein